MQTRSVLFVLCTLALPLALEADDRFVSPAKQVALVELFTSEGCSSCPPADRYMCGLRDEPGLWKEFVPLAWHVDYWDGLGWPDPFASRDFTARQREYAREWRERSVYTPAVVLSGKPWRAWRRGALPTAPEDRIGILEAGIAADGSVTVAFTPAEGVKGPWVVHAAILGSNLVSEVRAGENRGRELRHDFVVLEHAQEEMERNSGKLKLRWPARKAPLALAVWLTRTGSMQLVQACGGWLKSD